MRGRWHALRTTAHDTCRVDQPHMNRWTDCKRVRYGEPATLCAAGTDMHLAAPLPYWATLNSCRQLLTLTGMDNVTAAWRRSDSHRLEAHLTLRRHTMLRVHTTGSASGSSSPLLGDAEQLPTAPHPDWDGQCNRGLEAFRQSSTGSTPYSPSAYYAASTHNWLSSPSATTAMTEAMYSQASRIKHPQTY